MPVYNAASTVDMAIWSLALQSYANWELIVVDDGSTDDSVQRIRAFKDTRIHVVADGQRRGVSERLNDAMKLARGSFFARMDADDVSYPTRLAEEVEMLTLRPEVDLVGTGMLVFRDGGEPVGKRVGNPLDDGRYRFAISSMPVGHPTFCGRASWFRVNPYRKDYALAEDQELLLRMARKSTFMVIPKILHGYRENRLSFVKQFRSRTGAVRIAGALQRDRGTAWAGLFVLSQTAKLAFDTAAILTGLQHRLLRHRARPISDRETEEWRRMWSQVTQRCLG